MKPCRVYQRVSSASTPRHAPQILKITKRVRTLIRLIDLIDIIEAVIMKIM